jgi:PPP family 3-phenylpropionic acid transporter
MWGSFGYGLTTLVAGAIFGWGGYALLFVLSAAVTALSALLIRALPARTAEKANPGQRAKMSRGINFYLLAGSVFLFYIGNAAFSGFSFIYYQKELGADNGLIGLVTSLSAWSEIPAMLLIDWLIRRWNLRRMLIIGTAGLAVIWLMLSMLHGTSLLLPTLLILGTFFACQTVAITLLIAEISPPEIVATNQALIQVTVPGIATLLTGLASGWIFDQFGGRVLFQTIGILGLVSALLIVLVRRRLMPYALPAGLEPLPEPEVA